MQETLNLLLANNKGAYQPAHPRSLVSAFVIRYLKSKETRSNILILLLQHYKTSGFAPGMCKVPSQERDNIKIHQIDQFLEVVVRIAYV